MLVATNVAARGLDISDLTHVINEEIKIPTLAEVVNTKIGAVSDFIEQAQLQACVDAIRDNPITKKAPRVSLVEDVGSTHRRYQRHAPEGRFFSRSRRMQKRRR